MKAPKILLLIVLSGFFTANFAFAQAWTQTSAPTTNWLSIACSADGMKLAAVVYIPPDARLAPASPIYVSTNSGTTWTPTGPFWIPIGPFPENSNWGNIASSADGAKLVVSSTFGPLYTSADSGITWTATGPPSGDPWYDFAVIYWAGVASSADGKELVAAVFFDNTSIYISTNSGSTWTATTASTTGQGWSSVASSADGRQIAATTFFDTIYISTNSGTDWSATTAPAAIWSSIASSSDGKKLVATAYNNGEYGAYPGSIYTSADSGSSWIITSAPSNSWQAVASSADGNILVAAVWGGLIYTSTNSGSSWNAADAPSTNWQFVACSSDGSKLFAGVEGGGIWTAQTMPGPSLNLVPTNSNLALSWLVPSTSFVLQQSTDLSSWSDVTNQPVLNLTNLQNEVTLPFSGSEGFYRLKTP